MEMKKYTDIERLKDKYTSAFSKGEHIIISEKIDGANASIRCDIKGNLVACSRKQILSNENTLQGFYNYVQSLDSQAIFKAIGTQYIIFGEWLVKHSITYPESCYKQFYVFDVWNISIERYMPWSFTKKIANDLNLKTVPIFCDGLFTSWEDIYNYVGKTEMGASPSGEGIVIKSQDRLDNKFSGTPAYVKIVSKQFSEVHKSKVQNIDPAKMAKIQAQTDLASSIVTERRVVKLLEKFVDEGLLPKDYDEKNLKDISKILPHACFEDCKKEEPEIVNSIDDFEKLCSKISMNHARNIVGG